MPLRSSDRAQHPPSGDDRARTSWVSERISGFYAVIDRADEALATALVGPGGAKVLQVRVKPASGADVWRVATMARRVCSVYGAALIVNDRIDVARATGADGVHLGQLDIPIEAATRWRDELIIGVSTHNVDQVARAVANGADYLGFGPIYATTTKLNPDPSQGIAGLRSAVGVAGATPIVAIGGITPDAAPQLYQAGAAAVCAIAAVNGAADVVKAARSMGLHNDNGPLQTSGR